MTNRKISKSTRIALLSLCAVLLLTAVGLIVGNRKRESDAPYPFSGRGEDSAPYLIDSAEDLIALSRAAAEGETFEDSYFLQTADLDFGDVDTFTPIVGFAGTYNGGGYTVTGLTVADTEKAGLFTDFSGHLMNLGVEDSTFSGSIAGSLVANGLNGESLIVNCTSTATVSGTAVAGGITGQFDGALADCAFLGKATAPISGGILGTGEATLFDCAASGALSGALLPERGEKNSTNLDEGAFLARKENFAANAKLTASATDLFYRVQFSGTGKESAPFLLSTAEDFLLFAAMVNNGFSFNDRYLALAADIDLSNTKNFTPIGIADSGVYFWGTLNGKGHAIRNLTIYDPDGAVALFGALAGELFNLSVEDSEICGAYAATFSAKAGSSDALIVNCTSNATLLATERAGGIADSVGGLTILNCCFGGEIKSEGDAFGIVSFWASTVQNCHAAGYPATPSGLSIPPSVTGNHKNVSTAATLVNLGMYGGARKATLLNHSLNRFKADGTLGGTYPMWICWLLSVTVMAALLFFLAITVYTLWYAAEQKTRPSLAMGRELTRELFDKLKIRTDPLRETRDGRMRLLVLSLFLGGSVLFILSLLCGDISTVNTMVGVYGEDTFMDFFNPTYTMQDTDFFSTGHYVNAGGTYPPVARFVFLLLGKMLPYSVQRSDAFDMRNSAFGMMLYAAFAIIVLLSLFLLFTKGTKKGEGKYLLALLLILSPSIIYTVERGNIVMLSFLFAALFIAGYRSENAFVRQLSYLALGLSAAIKIYPVVLGLLVLKRKKADEIFSCLAWGVGICILPFAITDGASGLLLYIRNITESFASYEIGYDTYLLNYRNILKWLFGQFGSIALGDKIASFTLYPLMTLLVAAFALSQRESRQLLALTLILVLLPGYSIYYIAPFYILPLLELLGEKDKEKKDYVYLVALTLMLMPFQFLCGAFGLHKSTPVYFIGLIGVLLAFFLIADTIREKILVRKAARN